MQHLNKAIRDATAQLLHNAGPEAAVELRHILAETVEPPLEPGVAPHAADAVRRHLPGILTAGFPAPLAAIAAPLAAIWERLDWHYGYPERDDAPGLGSKVAFAQLVGPGGPLGGPAIRVGFTFMAPGVLYPMHAHPAVELYVVLSGRARWTQSGRSAWRDPGAAIVHATDEPHAMETVAEPLLALYSWRGDILEGPRYV